MKTLVVLCAAACISLCRAVEVDESVVATSEGELFHVENIIDNNRSISILKKQGETVEIQSSDENKRYTIVKKNETCIVTFNQENQTGCHEAFDHDDRYTNDEIQEIVQECQGNRIDYVKAVSCTNGSIQKRACYYRCIYRIIWRRINGRWYYWIYRICYRYCS